MFDIYSLPSVGQDRDVSRAAAERYLLLQALSERRATARKGARKGRVHRLLNRLPRSIRALPTGRDAATAEAP